MPASGGSVTDNSVPTNKVVKGQKHYLAYITPDEGKSLVNQDGVPTMTNEELWLIRHKIIIVDLLIVVVIKEVVVTIKVLITDIQDLSQVLDIMGNQKLLHLQRA